MPHSFLNLDEQVAELASRKNCRFAESAIFGLAGGIPFRYSPGKDRYSVLLGIQCQEIDRDLLLSRLAETGLKIHSSQVQFLDSGVLIPLPFTLLRKTARHHFQAMTDWLSKFGPELAGGKPLLCSFCGGAGRRVVLENQVPTLACESCLSKSEVTARVEVGIDYEEYKKGVKAFSHTFRLQGGFGFLCFLPALLMAKVFNHYPEFNLLDRTVLGWITLASQALATLLFIRAIQKYPRLREIISAGSRKGFESSVTWLMAFLMPLIAVDPLVYFGAVNLNCWLDHSTGRTVACHVEPTGHGYLGNHLVCDGYPSPLRIPYGKGNFYGPGLERGRVEGAVRILIRDGALGFPWVAHIEKAPGE